MPHPHGTINRYNNQRCRCDLCRAAIRDYRRAQRAHARIIERPRTNSTSTSADPAASAGAPVAKIAGYQLAYATCGHQLWLESHVDVTPGGWVKCPEHRITGVRRVLNVSTVPRDALRGSGLTDQP
jgi:hypothetical protein